jgi:putative hydrolase of the HAD superfamily
LVKAILFDLDGVLTTDATGTQSICNYICKKTGLDSETFKKEYYQYNKDLLNGKINHENIWDKLCKGLNTNIDIEILKESFVNTPMDSKMLRIVSELKQQNYKIAMVTDNKKDRIDSIVNFYNWDKLFDEITISAEVGLGKDNSEIFEKTIKNLNVNADECVFIDNQKKNLIIPESMGMKVIYFDHDKRSYDSLFGEFRKLSITI